MHLPRILLALALLLCHAASSGMQGSIFEAKSASTRQETCAECYEKDTFDNESETCENTDQSGSQAGQDQRLTYEKVTDIFTSQRQQNLIHLTLDNGQQLTATEGHPFLTSEGWRDAVLLKRGGKLLIKGESEADRAATLEKAIYKPNQPLAHVNTAQSAIENIVNTHANAPYRTILEVRQEVQTVPVYNIEVANAHTFLWGKRGCWCITAWVHTPVILIMA
ncbi:MAG: hypothetical protein HC765_14310 [Brachymonas sp.]|nr:hypothetical protein [Brachymonas sp.]